MKTTSQQNKKYYSCAECGDLFATHEDLNSHNQKHHACGLIPESIVVSKLAEKTEIVKESKTEEIYMIICDIV